MKFDIPGRPHVQLNKCIRQFDQMCVFCLSALGPFTAGQPEKTANCRSEGLQTIDVLERDPPSYCHPLIFVNAVNSIVERK